MDVSTIVTAIVGLLGSGGAIGYLCKFFIDKWKLQSDSDIAHVELKAKLNRTEHDELFTRYREMIDDLKKSLDSMRMEINTLQTEHTRCRIENEALKGEVRLLRSRITDVEQEMRHGPAPRPPDENQSPTGRG